MLNGAVIVFTGVLSRMVFKVRLSMLKWFGIMLVIAGLCIVGVTDMLFVGDSGGSNFTGWSVWLWKNFCSMFMSPGSWWAFLVIALQPS